MTGTFVQNVHNFNAALCQLYVELIELIEIIEITGLIGLNS